MAYSHYDRLTALDATFLEIEEANVHMHVGAVGIFDARPLRRADGGLDIDRIIAVSDASLRKTPRFRQRLAHVPLFGYPVWVDDDRFNLVYHLRHAALPPPGDVRQLKRLTGRIMSQQLDRGKPLWEMWFVDGLENDHFAVITKVHHCMIDGLSGVDLLAALITVDPNAGAAHEQKRWLPRPAPTPAELLRDELTRRAQLPVAALRAGLAALRDPAGTLKSARDAVEGIGGAIATGLAPASPTPLNVDIGPHRRFDWTHFDLQAVREVKNRLGGTLNDVVLTIVAGALRRFLKGRGEDPKALDFRAMLPVSVRTLAERGSLGNRVSFLVAALPLAERDPRARLRQVSETTAGLKRSKQVRGAEVLEEISDWTFSTLFIDFVRLAARQRSYNIVVTNVPGPQFPVFLLGARMKEIYPLVPLFTNQALGIALFSFDGGLYWGFNSDWDALPDLHELVEAVEHEFELLRETAAGLPGSTVTKARKKQAAKPAAPPVARKPRRKRASRAARRL
jgi:diacylglycerol O-acyltransferase / wax synthase